MKGVTQQKYQEGQFANTKIAIIVTAWNKFIVDPLQEGSISHLTANGVSEANITIIE